MFQMIGIFAEFERNVIVERAGWSRAQAALRPGTGMGRMPASSRRASAVRSSRECQWVPYQRPRQQHLCGGMGMPYDCPIA